MELGAQASFVVDWRQTQAAVDRANAPNHSMAEENPIIGDHGQNMSPDAYFLTVGLLHVAIAAVLPPKARFAFQAATIGWQAQNDWLNHEVFDAKHRLEADIARRR